METFIPDCPMVKRKLNSRQPCPRAAIGPFKRMNYFDDFSPTIEFFADCMFQWFH